MQVDEDDGTFAASSFVGGAITCQPQASEIQLACCPTEGIAVAASSDNVEEGAAQNLDMKGSAGDVPNAAAAAGLRRQSSGGITRAFAVIRAQVRQGQYLGRGVGRVPVACCQWIAVKAHKTKRVTCSRPSLASSVGLRSGGPNFANTESRTRVISLARAIQSIGLLFVRRDVREVHRDGRGRGGRSGRSCRAVMSQLTVPWLDNHTH